MTTELQPTRSIVPIIRYSPLQPIAEILGTGFFVGTPEMLAVVTAKHVFTACSLKDDEKFAIAFLTEKGAAIVALSRVIGSLDFDVAAADVDSQHLPGAFPLPRSHQCGDGCCGQRFQLAQTVMRQGGCAGAPTQDVRNREGAGAWQMILDAVLQCRHAGQQLV